MSVYDFCMLSTEDNEEVAVFDIFDGVEVYRGPYVDVWYEPCSEYEVENFSIKDGILILNVDSSEYLVGNDY